MSDPISIKLFRVGGANSIAIYYNDDKCLLFDCGMDCYDREKKELNKRKYKKEEEEILSIKPTAVVISHNHEDHFNLFCDLELDSVEHIVKRNTPDYRIYSKKNEEIIKAKRNGNVVFEEINLDDAEVEYDTLINEGYGGTYIYTPKAVPTDENTNETGLILVVYSQTKNRKVILPADVSYDMWPDKVKAVLKNDHPDTKPITLVLPHHGGTVLSDNFRNDLGNAALNHDIKFFRCSRYDKFKGNQNSENHFNFIKALYGNSITVLSTEEADQDGYFEILP